MRLQNRLEVKIAGLRLSNPTILAAGILGLSGASIKEIIDNGAGAVVTKSIGLKPRRGYDNPAVVQVDYSLLNAMGLPNPGIHDFIKEIRQVKESGTKVPIIVSIYGHSPEEFAEVARIAMKGGSDALELNLSCPHVDKTGSEIGQKPPMVVKTVKAVKNCVNKPVIVKLTPNVADICEVAEAAVKAGADAITAINTVRAMAIDIETSNPILANRIGGLSGPAIKPIAVRCVYEIFRAVKVPIIGCGGIMTWQDAVEFFLAGAAAVQIGTAIAMKGLKVFKSVSNGIELYLRRKNLQSVAEVVGSSHHN